MPTSLTIVAFVLLLAGVIVMASRRSGYSHVRNTISELGESGAVDGRWVAFGIFLPVGLLLLMVAAAVNDINHSAALLAVCIGVGYLGAVVAPCDVGSPMNGSFRQSIHNLAGGIQYVGGAISIWKIEEQLGSYFVEAGWIVVAGAVAISIPGLLIRGLVQRVVEAILFASLAHACWLSSA